MKRCKQLIPSTVSGDLWMPCAKESITEILGIPMCIEHGFEALDHGGHIQSGDLGAGYVLIVRAKGLPYAGTRNPDWWTPERRAEASARSHALNEQRKKSSTKEQISVHTPGAASPAALPPPEAPDGNV